MAIYTLPNSASWDDSLQLHEQTEEAQEFWNNLDDTATPVDTTEAIPGTNRSRVLTRIKSDTTNSDYDYKISYSRTYINPPSHREAFRIASTSKIYQILSK